MAQTGRIAGTDLYVTFAGVVVNGDFTGFDPGSTAVVVPLPASNDTFTYKVTTGRKDGKATLKSLFDPTGGTAAWQAMAEGSIGTLIWAELGTASAKPKSTCNRAIVSSRNKTIPFEGAVEFTVEFEFSAAVTEDVYS